MLVLTRLGARRQRFFRIDSAKIGVIEERVLLRRKWNGLAGWGGRSEWISARIELIDQPYVRRIHAIIYSPPAPAVE